MTMKNIYCIDLEEIKERVLARIDRDGKNSNECWPWTGGKKSSHPTHKYGQFNVRVGPRSENKTVTLSVHRLAYIYANGSIPEDLDVLHKCNNPICCNHHHLYAGTQQQNMDDMKAAKNSTAGTRNVQAKLTDQQVAEIKALPESERWTPTNKKGWTLKKVAKQYGVSHATIGYIRQGKIWNGAV